MASPAAAPKVAKNRHPSDVLLASLCGHGHSIPPFRFSCMRTKKYALQGTYPCEKRGEGPLYFALFKKDAIRFLNGVPRRGCGRLVERVSLLSYIPSLRRSDSYGTYKRVVDCHDACKLQFKRSLHVAWSGVVSLSLCSELRHRQYRAASTTPLCPD